MTSLAGLSISLKIDPDQLDQSANIVPAPQLTPGPLPCIECGDHVCEESNSRCRDLTFRYVTHPIFELPSSAAFIGGLRGKHIRSHHVFNYAEGQTQWEEAYALRIIEELLNCGWILSRLKNCETCARWVFHLKSGGKYCENKICKNEPYEANPERVQRKRLTAKNNYHDAKERERRNLKRVKERGAR